MSLLRDAVPADFERLAVGLPPQGLLLPEAGLVTMVIVLQAAGVPVSCIGTILAIDWFLDRMRTTVNVCGDAIGCAVVDEHVVRHE